MCTLNIPTDRPASLLDEWKLHPEQARKPKAHPEMENGAVGGWIEGPGIITILPTFQEIPGHARQSPGFKDCPACRRGLLVSVGWRGASTGDEGLMGVTWSID